MGALLQAFYVSQPFRDLRYETRDLRFHPVLGGISSTRWHAYNTFARRNSRLAAVLADRPGLRPAIQLVSDPSPPELPIPQSCGIIRSRHHRDGALPAPGLLAGDAADNSLRGTDGADVLLGLAGADRLSGEGGGDVLCGGPGADTFHFSRDAVTDPGDRDQITDFQGDQGDRLSIEGADHLIGMNPFSGTPGELAWVVWMADLDPQFKGPIRPWMIQGLQLQLDRDGDRQADLSIDLPGLSGLDPSWLISG